MTEQYFFHPDYDGHVHVDYAKLSSIGTSFVGSMGLLSRLELKTGLIHAEYPNDDCEREEQYKVAIRKRKSSLKCLDTSFAMDEVNVTRQILRWRDALKMADWNFVPNPSYSDVLNDIAEIESNFNSSIVGISDRWIAIKRYLDGGKSLSINITVNCDKSQIHPTIAYILDKLGAKYAALSDVNGGNVTAYKFKDAYDAYQAAALTLDPKKDILIVQNPQILNDALKSVDHQAIDASVDTDNSSVVQLFKTLLLIFAEPNNFRNVVSYLKTLPCPINEGGKLGDYLLDNCGWGSASEWSNFISEVNNYKKWDDATNSFVALSCSEVGDIQDEYNNFKSFVLGISSPAGGIEIKQKIDDLIAWSKKYNSDPAIRSQKMALRDLCRRVTFLLNTNKNYTSDEIRAMVDNINASYSFKVGLSTVDSFMTYPSFGCVVDSVNNGSVVWVDCFGSLGANYDYSFLSPSDVVSLQKNNVGIWKKTDQVAAKISLLSSAVRHAGKDVVLFIPQNSEGERTMSSPLLTEFGIDVAKLPAYSKLTVSQLPVVPFASTPQTSYYKLKVAIPQRKHESYSSLNMLINTPFDYVLQYACGLYAPNVSQLEGLKRICGSVAHKTFENMCNANSGNVVAIKNIVASSNFDKEIENSALESGIVLLLPENTFLLSELTANLRVSFTNLLDIIANNNLTIVGNEVHYQESSSAIVDNNDLDAIVDLVLKNQQGEICVFDLKYGNPKSYKTNLLNDRALQLDIYKYCVEHSTTSKVAMVGYFNLIEGKLFTAYSGFRSDENIDVVTPKNPLTNVMDMVKNSYSYRFEEFNTYNRLEEGEGADINALNYKTDPSLYPLKEEGSQKSLRKAVNNFSSFTLFKGGHK